MIARALALVLAVASLAVVARATDLFYGDFTARSPDGRYEFTARSPDNRGFQRGRRAFQSDFTYTFRETKSGRVLWRAKQEEGGALGTAPITGAAIHPSGWCVLSDAHDGYHCVDPAGRRTGALDLLTDGFSADERKRYVHDTTAGPTWGGLSFSYFVETGGQLYYCLRPWWGRRVILNVAQGKKTAASRALQQACSKIEREECLNALRAGIAGKQKLEDDPCSELCGRTVRGAYLAGALRIREAIPLLRQLEDSRAVMSSGGGFHNDDFPPGAVLTNNSREYTLRLAAQLSLRRLGEAAGPYPSAHPKLNVDRYDSRGYVALPNLPAPRHTRVAAVRAGLTPEDVIALISAPDVIADGAWEYDMDDAKPYTLVIKWDGRRSKSVERVRPPRWQKGTVRDEELVY